MAQRWFMARVVMMAWGGKNRAAPVAERLAAAESELAELEGWIGQCALDELESLPGAAAKIAALMGRIAAVRVERDKLEQAHRLACELDYRAEITARAKIRASQFAAFQAHLRTRDAALVEIAAGAAVTATAHRNYLRAAEQAIAVMPIGTRLSATSLGLDGIGSLATTLKYLDQREIQPAIEQLRQTGALAVSEIKAQIARIDDAETDAIATGFRPALPIAALGSKPSR
jgi:hypothetical protein